MRQARHGMVQREEQYVFIHRVVADYERHIEEEAEAAATAASAAAVTASPSTKDSQKRQRTQNRCSMDEPLRDELNEGAENRRASGVYVPEGGHDLLIS